MSRIPPAAWLAVCLLGGGCGPELLPPLGRPEADVRLELAAREVPSGEPLLVTVTLQQADGVTLTAAEPAAEGLQASLADERTEPFDGWSLTTRSYRLAGPDGSYVIEMPGVVARHPDGREEPLEIAPAFADIGVKGPSAELEGLLLPEPPEPARWPWALAAGVALGLGLAGLTWAWRRRRRRLRAVPVEPPDVVAARAWAAVLADRGLDDHARALQLSEVFRGYLQAVHPIPASALTSREIVDAIYAGGLVPGALLDRARRLLHATDLLKFARQGGGIEFFCALDGDFQAYLVATRPRPAEPGSEARRA